MRRNARNAFKALTKIGAPVIESKGDWREEFILSAENNDTTVWADYYHEMLKEAVVDDKIIHAFGINQKVHDILTKHGLMTEWIDPGTIGIYQN